MKKEKVLIIAPHLDDEVLGCSGAIIRHCQHGDLVNVVFVAHRIYTHQFDAKKYAVEKKHAATAQSILGYDKTFFLNLNDERLDVCLQDIIIPLEEIVNRLKPSQVYVPFHGDNNQDHRAVFDAARVVLRPLATPFIRGFYLYETPSCTDQSPPLPEYTFVPNYYIDIARYIDTKIRAYRAYKTECRAFPHPRSEQALRIQAQKRGIEAGLAFAEAFMILRQKWY